MNFEGFINQSYASPASQVDSERTSNLYVENIASDGGSASVRAVLVRTPGLSLLQTLGASPGRGTYAINGRCFAVAGGSFYELVSTTAAILRGSFPGGTSPVAFDSNGVQVLMLADGKGYIFALASNTFTPITSAGFPAYCVSICSIDTYFLALGSGSNQFLISNLLDGLNWSSINFGSSQEPDNAVAIAANHLNLWIFGQNETILFQDTGNANFPFQRIPGSQIEMGCGAAKSIVTLDNTLFWLGSSTRGPAVVYRADGFLPTRISNHAMEAAMQGYSTTADATAYSYEENGHLFYRIDFPSANSGAGATWVYDVATKMWHERSYWNLAAGTESADLARYHSFCFGVHLVMDFNSGNVYAQSLAYATHAGNPLRWLRRAPHITDGETWLFYSSFQLRMQTGGGLDGGVQGSNPVVYLRWSNDGGMTYSDLHAAFSGALGQFLQRVRWLRLGRARSRVFEASGSDPIPQLVLIGAEMDVEKGIN